jgi:hypothetical protein
MKGILCTLLYPDSFNFATISSAAGKFNESNTTGQAIPSVAMLPQLGFIDPIIMNNNMFYF